MNIDDVVQFNENHDWCGCLGIIIEKKEIHNDNLNSEGKNDIRFMVGVPSPEQGTTYVRVMQSEFAIELIGKAKLVVKGDEDEN